MNTTESPVLDLGLKPEEFDAAPRRNPRRVAVAAVIVVAAVTATAQFVAGPGYGRLLEAIGFARPTKAAVALHVTPRQQSKVAQFTVDDQSQIVVEGKLAEQRNKTIPVSGLPLEHVRGFLLANGERAGAYGTALTCLSQAIYYEAAYEPLAGRRAVAQVVLNRMRHPAYPKSVCGVVYQGSERRTGCQFSFTCDGSLLRSPAAAAWRAAQEVARAALSGHVEPSVGTATHYHADYVLPKWAFNLAKIQQIGAHIFYRFNGNWGTSRAFTGAYSGSEHIPAINYDLLRQRQAGAGTGFGGEIVPGLTVPPHVTDRHDPRDVGGRINVTKLWRLNIPDPTQSSSGYRAALEAQGVEEEKPLPVSNSAASVIPEE